MGEEEGVVECVSKVEWALNLIVLSLSMMMWRRYDYYFADSAMGAVLV